MVIYSFDYKNLKINDQIKQGINRDCISNLMVEVVKRLNEFIQNLNKIKNDKKFSNNTNKSGPGYARLIKSLPLDEKMWLYEDMKNTSKDKIQSLVSTIHTKGISSLITGDSDKTRTVFVTALRALQSGKITVEQVASMHILDAAIQELIIHRSIRSFRWLAGLKNGQRLCEFLCVNYDKKIDSSNSPETIRYGTKIYSRKSHFLNFFFHLNDEEWKLFHEIMNSKNVPDSEKDFSLIVIPKPTLCCWSVIITRIQEKIISLHGKSHSNSSPSIRTIDQHFMPIPSFTMFQAFITVKCKNHNRVPLKLIPTYGFLEKKDYAKTKKTGIPVSLYFPERSKKKRYSNNNKLFAADIDGHQCEKIFAAVLHDIFHAIYEIQMSKKMSDARFRLAEIAIIHTNNKKNEFCIPVDDILVDGELIFSYKKTKTDTFRIRPDHAQKFGEIFYTGTLKHLLHPKLKKAFIRDMVKYKELWKTKYDLGRKDLLSQDQKIYDQILNSMKFST